MEYKRICKRTYPNGCVQYIAQWKSLLSLYKWQDHDAGKLLNSFNLCSPRGFDTLNDAQNWLNPQKPKDEIVWP